MRAWARENGYDVADRGRLPAEIQDAYVAAHRRGTKPAKKAAAKPVAKKPTASSTKAAPAQAAPKPPAAQEPVHPPAAPAAESTEKGRPQPKPSPVTDDRRLVALGEELAALTERVAALEAAVGTKGNGKSGGKGNGKTARFRRSR